MNDEELKDLANELYKENIILKKKNEELVISIKLFEDDIATKDKKIDEQQEQIDLLEKNRKMLNKWLDEYVDKFTEVWRIVESCRRG